MGLSGLFSIGLSGVNAYAASLEAISQNVANTQTAGYKRAQTDFSTLISALAPSGGISGGGVAAQNRVAVDEQGAITRTQSATDIAIEGDGFFVVSETADAGAPVSFTRSGSFSINGDGDLVNAAGYFLRGSPVGDAGQSSVGGLSALQVINIDQNASVLEPTSQMTLAGRLPLNATPGDLVSQTVNITDENGDTRSVNFEFSVNASGGFDVRAVRLSDNVAIANGALAFDANGRIDRDASTLPRTLEVAPGQSASLDLSGLIRAAGAATFSEASADGAPAGFLTGVEITGDGFVNALYSNGLQRSLYQVPLATFANQSALQEGAVSTFLATTQAGDVSLNGPQSGRAGTLQAGALELSTVDIGQEFSRLIETQRAYAANTRIISVGDELWRTLTETAR